MILPYLDDVFQQYMEADEASIQPGRVFGVQRQEVFFFQCPNEMPQVPIIREIVDVVKKEELYFIVTIGGNSIESLFTFTFSEQTHSYARKELGLPEDV